MDLHAKRDHQESRTPWESKLPERRLPCTRPTFLEPSLVLGKYAAYCLLAVAAFSVVFLGLIVFVFSPLFIFNNIGRFVFRFVLGSFFPQLLVFNNFSASFLGSFRFVFDGLSFVFNNFSGSFFKKRVFLSHTFSSKLIEPCFQRLTMVLEVRPDYLTLPLHCPINPAILEAIMLAHKSQAKSAFACLPLAGSTPQRVALLRHRGSEPAGAARRYWTGQVVGYPNSRAARRGQ